MSRVILNYQDARKLYEEILEGFSKEDLIKAYLDELGRIRIMKEMSQASTDALRI